MTDVDEWGRAQAAAAFWKRTCKPPKNRAELAAALDGPFPPGLMSNQVWVGWLSLYTGHCAAPIDVTRMGSAEPEYLCGCGACPPPPAVPKPCVCGQIGTHRPDPGVGCTTPGCLCLEPGEHQ